MHWNERQGPHVDHGHWTWVAYRMAKSTHSSVVLVISVVVLEIRVVFCAVVMSELDHWCKSVTNIHAFGHIYGVRQKVKAKISGPGTKVVFLHEAHSEQVSVEIE